MGKKSEKLSIRERKFIKGLAAGLTPTEAMRQAGYSEATSIAKAGLKVKESRVQASIQEMMEKRGLTKDKLLDKLNEGLDATKVISANVVATGGEGMADAHGTTKDFIEVPDFMARHKYVDTSLKLGDHYPTEKVEHSGGVEITVTKKVVAIGAKD